MTVCFGLVWPRCADVRRAQDSFSFGGGFISSNALTTLRLVPTPSARPNHLID